MKKRITKITRTRRFRVTKKNPKSLNFVLNMDMGNVAQQISVFAPRNSEVRNVEIKKDPNPNLVRFSIGQNSLVYYLDSEKGFIYGKNGIFAGSFEKHDIKHLGSSILNFFKNIDNRKRIQYSMFLKAKKQVRNSRGRFQKCKK
jgi:hypothetical protein